VHGLGRDQPKTTKELLNITTRHASDEEALRAVFIQGDRKAAVTPGFSKRIEFYKAIYLKK
jgi:hypothetical protein